MESQTVQEKEPRLLPIVKLHGITKRITGLIHFFSSGYLILTYVSPVHYFWLVLPLLVLRTN